MRRNSMDAVNRQSRLQACRNVHLQVDIRKDLTRLQLPERQGIDPRQQQSLLDAGEQLRDCLPLCAGSLCGSCLAGLRGVHCTHQRCSAYLQHTQSRRIKVRICYVSAQQTTICIESHSGARL